MTACPALTRPYRSRAGISTNYPNMSNEDTLTQRKNRAWPTAVPHRSALGPPAVFGLEVCWPIYTVKFFFADLESWLSWLVRSLAKFGRLQSPRAAAKTTCSSVSTWIATAASPGKTCAHCARSSTSRLTTTSWRL